jgi:hypothetical protein
MSRRRFVLLAVAALLAISGALFLSTQRNLPRDTHDTALLPSLANELNSVTGLSVRKGAASPGVTVHLLGDQWTVAERADYPADVSKLRKLLLAMADTKIVEEKTSNPANFAVIGVEDPSQPGATGAEVTVIGHDGSHSVIVGKAVGQGNFARRSGENQSYIVQPGLSFESEPRFWIDSRLIDVAAATIQSIEVKPATGPVYTIQRQKPGDGDFGLEGAPAGRKPLDPHALAPSPTLLSSLAADDVSPASAIDFTKPAQAIVTQADGNVLTLTGAVAGDKRWIQVAASKDPTLSAKVQGRAFEVATYRYDAIFRPLEQLLVPKAPPPAEKKTSPPMKKPSATPSS